MRLTDERKARMIADLGQETADRLLAMDISARLRTAQHLADSASDEDGLHYTVAMLGPDQRGDT